MLLLLYYKVKHLSDQDKMRLLSQLMEGISRVFQKLLKHFNGTFISASFIRLVLTVLPFMFCLVLNEAMYISSMKISNSTSIS